MLICEACKKETNRTITEIASIGGRNVVIKYCPECPQDSEQGQRYTKKKRKGAIGRPLGSRNKVKVSDSGKLKQFENSEEEIKETQKYKPDPSIIAATKAKDDATREADRLPPNPADTEVFFVAANAQKLVGWREQKVAEYANGKFGYGRWKKVKDDGEFVTCARV